MWQRAKISHTWFRVLLLRIWRRQKGRVRSVLSAVPASFVGVSRLSRQRDFDCADVCWSATLFAWSWWQLLRANIYALYFDVRQESASAYFDDVNCSAYWHSSSFNFYFRCIAVEEGYACQNVIHRRLSSNQYCIAFTWLWHFLLSLLAIFCVKGVL